MENNHVCTFCEKTFTTRRSRIRHEKNVHKSDESLRKKLTCSECSVSYQTMDKFQVHLLDAHPEIQINVEKHSFGSSMEFEQWLKNVSKDTSSKYIKGERYKTSSGSICIYNCHRSGHFVSKSEGKRHLKIGGSCKIGFFCPARIKTVTQEKSGQVSIDVTFFSNHIGHQCEVGKLALTKDEKDAIAGKLLAGIPHQSILQNIAQRVSPTKRMALTKPQDLRNIAAKYGVNNSVIRSVNDALSVDLWVTEMEKSTNNPILLYKPYAVESAAAETNDFILVFMNDAQENILKLYGEEIISVDSTHGTNKYNIQLTSIVVRDDNWEGFPVAFLWSIRQTEDVFKLFFSAIYERIGPLKTKTFISDDYPAFYNAWKSVFGPSKFYLLCDWHVKRAWSKNASTGHHIIRNLDKRNEVLNDLFLLSREVDKLTFNKLLEIFILKFSSDLETQDFVNYFLRNYDNRKEQWAACYRIGANINTNMAVERWHKDLKYNSDLKGKCGGRLDRAIHSLMKSLQLKLQGRLVSLERGKLTKKISLLRKAHKTAEEKSKEIDILQTEDDLWIVPSFTQFGETYKVRQLKLDELHKCNLKCEICNTCLHEFRCSCPDSAIRYNLCKHIHVTCLTTKDVGSGALLKNDDDQVPELIIQTSEERKEQEKMAIGQELSRHKASNIKEDIKADISAILALVETRDAESELMEISQDIKTLKHKLEARKCGYQLPQVVTDNAPNKNITPQCRTFPEKKKKKKVFKPMKNTSLENIIGNSSNKLDS